MAASGRPTTGLHQKILDLLQGVDDPSIRVEVMRTIYFLYQVYASGRASEEEIAGDLMEVVMTVLAVKNPGQTEEERRSEAEQWVQALLDAMRAETLFRRMMANLRTRLAAT